MSQQLSRVVKSKFTGGLKETLQCRLIRGTTDYLLPTLQLKTQKSFQVYLSLTLIRVKLVCLVTRGRRCPVTITVSGAGISLDKAGINLSADSSSQTPFIAH